VKNHPEQHEKKEIRNFERARPPAHDSTIAALHVLQGFGRTRTHPVHIAMQRHQFGPVIHAGTIAIWLCLHNAKPAGR
jgi:hypothetical protein